MPIVATKETLQLSVSDPIVTQRLNPSLGSSQQCSGFRNFAPRHVFVHPWLTGQAEYLLTQNVAHDL